jgi:transcriptional regulator
MRRQKQRQESKDGGIFYSDIAAMHSRARSALLKAKKAEKCRQTIPVRINNKTIILVDAGADIDQIVDRFKNKLNNRNNF